MNDIISTVLIHQNDNDQQIVMGEERRFVYTECQPQTHL